jgi:hypothetical protein
MRLPAGRQVLAVLLFAFTKGKKKCYGRITAKEAGMLCFTMRTRNDVPRVNIQFQNAQGDELDRRIKRIHEEFWRAKGRHIGGDALRKSVEDLPDQDLIVVDALVVSCVMLGTISDAVVVRPVTNEFPVSVEVTFLPDADP